MPAVGRPWPSGDDDDDVTYDGDREADDEDAKDGAEAAEDLAEAGDRADISVANLEKIS